MKTTRLGRDGPVVSRIGLGCMNLSLGAGAAMADAERIALLHRAVELGYTLFDTAEMYGPFVNERLVGRALAPFRDRVTIATKFGFDIRDGETRPSGVNSRPDHVRAVCEASLLRLGVETIDLFYQHRVDPAVPIEDVAGAVGDLVREGKVRWFGLSEAAPATIRRAHAVHPVAALQTEYSLFSRDVEAEVLPTCRALGIGFVAYSPLGRGFLGGAARAMPEADFRARLPRWQGEARARNLVLLDALEAAAAQLGLTAAQLALAWLVHAGEDIVPIPGTTSAARLAQNAAAAAVRLDPVEVEALSALFAPGAVAGDRYDAAGAALLEG